MNGASHAHAGRKCPICGEMRLRERIVTEEYDYESDDGPVRVVAERMPMTYCEACGESYGGPEAIRIHDDAVRRALGVLMPAEIACLRERVGKSFSEFAQLTGFSEQELAHCERGDRIQNRANDILLRLLQEDARYTGVLEKIAAERRNGPTDQAVQTTPPTDAGLASPTLFDTEESRPRRKLKLPPRPPRSAEGPDPSLE
jgi:YgiT-type zinc finger domain-containing protein